MDEPGTDPAPLPLSALRLLVPPVQLISAAIWQTVQQGVVADYGMLEEFVSTVTDIVPELLSRQQRAELTLGLRARLILDLCRSEGTAELTTLQPHLDKMGILMGAWLTESQAADLQPPPDSHFVNFVKLLLSSRAERERYFQEVFLEEFGASYDAALRSLMRRFLSQLEKFLPLPTFQQVACMLGGASSVLVDATWPHKEELHTLLRHQRALRLPQHNDASSECSCIFSSLKIAVATNKGLHSAASQPMQSEAAAEVQRCKTGEAGVAIAAEEEAPGVVRECRVLLSRLEEPAVVAAAAASRSRPVRTNRGRKLKMILLEEKRDVEVEDDPHQPSQHPSAAAPPTDEDSWSHYSSRSSLDSWSHYSSEDPSCTSPLARFSPDSSSCSSDQDSFVASHEATSAKRAGTAQSGQQGECCICKQRVQSKLNAHMRSHFPDGVYTCPRCDGRFKLFSSLKLHLKRVCFENVEAPVGDVGGAADHGDHGALFRCGTCQQAFRHRLSLDVHARTHHELYCGVCRKVLRDRAALARHQSSHTPYQCTRCQSSFTIFKHLLRHCENVHQMGRRPFRCGHCPKVFSKLRVLIGHEWKHTGRLPFQCSQCSLKFKNDTDLVSHQRVHTREKPYLCSECGKTFSQRSNLLRHLQFVHSESRLEKKHACSECDKSFKEKGALIKHKRSKHFNQLFRHPCPYCGKMFSASSISRHKLIHTGERPFRCSISDCERFFRSTSEVKLHVLKHHSNERPFKCGVCAKGFVSAGTLNTHAKIHSGEKPFACHVCGKAFLKRYSMLRHKKLLHTHVAN